MCVCEELLKVQQQTALLRCSPSPKPLPIVVTKLKYSKIEINITTLWPLLKYSSYRWASSVRTLKVTTEGVWKHRYILKYFCRLLDLARCWVWETILDVVYSSTRFCGLWKVFNESYCRAEFVKTTVRNWSWATTTNFWKVVRPKCPNQLGQRRGARGQTECLRHTPIFYVAGNFTWGRKIGDCVALIWASGSFITEICHRR